MPFLKSVTIKFDTHNDDKDASTFVHVFVKNRLNSSLSPEANRDFISNWLAFQRYLSFGDINGGDRNPYLASGFFLGRNFPFNDPSSYSPVRSSTLWPANDA